VRLVDSSQERLIKNKRIALFSTVYIDIEILRDEVRLGLFELPFHLASV
jgi:hypothetical protein